MRDAVPGGITARPWREAAWAGLDRARGPLQGEALHLPEPRSPRRRTGTARLRDNAHLAPGTWRPARARSTLFLSHQGGPAPCVPQGSPVRVSGSAPGVGPGSVDPTTVPHSLARMKSAQGPHPGCFLVLVVSMARRVTRPSLGPVARESRVPGPGHSLGDEMRTPRFSTGKNWLTSVTQRRAARRVAPQVGRCRS